MCYRKAFWRGLAGLLLLAPLPAFSSRPDPTVCAFHRAAVELHQATTTVLGRCTLAQLLEQPHAVPPCEEGTGCLMAHCRYAAAPKNRPPSPFTQLGGVL